MLIGLTLAAAAPPPSSSAPAARVVAFQPGIRIDFARKQVELDGKIVLREGELELFACSGMGKAHESIVSLAARPQHIYQALGLIGRTPGRPATYDDATQTTTPAEGDPVEVLVRWQDHGVTRTVSAADWMQDIATGKPLKPTHWLFAGSVKLPDGRLAADLDGVVIPTVDFPSAILAIVPPAVASRPVSTAPIAPRPHPASAPAPPAGDVHVNQPDDLQLAPRTALIPPVGTKLAVILRAPH